VNLAREDLHHIAIIGDGLLGTELTFDLAHQIESTHRDLELVRIFGEESILASIFPRYFSQWAASKLRRMGVQLIPETFPKHIEADSTLGKASILFADGRQILVDEIILTADAVPGANPLNDLNIESHTFPNGFALNSRLEIMPDVFIVG
jgi:NADH dehydrogenase FAD-containing subunit